jgi:hypothetical protein
MINITRQVFIACSIHHDDTILLWGTAAVTINLTPLSDDTI